MEETDSVNEKTTEKKAGRISMEKVQRNVIVILREMIRQVK